jgi:hypothetical protein
MRSVLIQPISFNTMGNEKILGQRTSDIYAKLPESYLNPAAWRQIL